MHPFLAIALIIAIVLVFILLMAIAATVILTSIGIRHGKKKTAEERSNEP